MKYKFWTLSFLLFFLGYILVNFCVWILWTETILAKGDFPGGDLARMGYVYQAKIIRHNIDTLPVKHIELHDLDNSNQQIDVITIGDSFSNGGGGGENRFYQDWLASEHHLTVVNIQHLPYKTDIETLIILANGGFFDKYKPKYVLLSGVVRNIINRYDINLDTKAQMSNIDQTMRSLEYKDHKQTYNFINSGNMNFLLYNFLYNFSDHAFISQCYKTKLKQSFFTSKEGDLILMYVDDLKVTTKINSKKINNINANINKVAFVLKEKNIKLYFMPIVDKYDLYNDFMINNKYPKNIFFDEFRKITNKNYDVIDTKAILLNELLKGEQDIYYIDDTHWNWKAPKVIFENTLLK